MRSVPIDVELSMEWARASTLARVLYAEVRPKARERLGVAAPDESPADLLARVARAVQVPLRASDAAPLLAEGERAGFWRVAERLVDGERVVFLVVPALPPSVLRARREAEEAERGARGGKTDRQRQREHRERERGPAPLAALPGTEVPAGWAAQGEEPSSTPPPPAQGGQVFGGNVTARSREIPLENPPPGRDAAPRGSGGPPSLSGTPSGVPREGGGGPAPDAPAPPAATTGGAALALSPSPGPVAPADAAAWARALGDAASEDKPARRAALEALGRGLVAAFAAKVGREVFDGRAATAEELRGLGAVLAREGVDRAKLLEVRGWLAAEGHESARVRSGAREAFRWDEAVRARRAPVTVALLVGKRVGEEHRGSGWRAAAKASGAWAEKVRASGVALTFSEDGPGPVRATAEAPAAASGGAARG